MVEQQWSEHIVLIASVARCLQSKSA